MMFAGEAVLPAGVEVAVCGDGAEFEHSFDAGQAPEAPLMSRRSAMRCLTAPSMIPVAMGQPAESAWS